MGLCTEGTVSPLEQSNMELDHHLTSYQWSSSKNIISFIRSIAYFVNAALDNLAKPLEGLVSFHLPVHTTSHALAEDTEP